MIYDIRTTTRRRRKLQEQEKKSRKYRYIYIMIKEIPKHTRINCITFIIRELAVHAYIHIHTDIIYTQIYVIYYI